MDLDLSTRFNRDLRRVRDPVLRRRVSQRIAELEATSSISDMSSVVRVQSSSGRHYRIRIGDYRLGIMIEGDVVVLARFLHRREFYSHFP